MEQMKAFEVDRKFVETTDILELVDTVVVLCAVGFDDESI